MNRSKKSTADHSSKANKEKPDDNGDGFLKPDLIKKEPEDVPATAPGPATASVVTVAKSSEIGKTILTLTSSSGPGSKPIVTQPKTILLVQTVNNRTGGIQSHILPPGIRTLPSTMSGDSLAKSVNPRSVITISPVTGKTATFAMPKTPDCLTTPTSNMAVKVTTVTLPSQSQPESQHVRNTTISELTFKSRTIQADGTVSTLKEYLCNFCQFKVASHVEFEQHFTTHVFSCNYCTFRAFTRFEVLSHKKEKHPTALEELAGYEGLDKLIEQNSTPAAAIVPSGGPVAERFQLSVSPVQSPAQTSTVATSSTVSLLSDVTEAISTTPKTSAVILSTASNLTSTIQSSLLSPHTFTINSRVLPSRSTSTPMSSVLNIATPSWSCTTPLLSPTTGKFSQRKVTVPTSTTMSGGITIVSASPVASMKTTATVGKSDDNYFTYKIVHDSAGKVQAYECDVCNYRSTKMNEISRTPRHTPSLT